MTAAQNIWDSKSDMALPDFTEIAERGLYVPELEHDACGVGMVANIKGSRSRSIIDQALEVLVNLGHRGAAGADPMTGDGAGITIQMPDAFMRKIALQEGINLPSEGRYAVAMCFLPNDDHLNTVVRATLEKRSNDNGMAILGWREVPVEPNVIGLSARSIMPKIAQLFVSAPDDVSGDDFERNLYLARKSAEKQLLNIDTDPETRKTLLREFYVCSWSSRTLIYKGMLLVDQLSQFYLDLEDHME